MEHAENKKTTEGSQLELHLQQSLPGVIYAFTPRFPLSPKIIWKSSRFVAGENNTLEHDFTLFPSFPLGLCDAAKPTIYFS